MSPRAATTASAPVTITALPTTVNLNLYAGDDFTMTLTVTNPDTTPADLTGASAEAQIRVAASEADPVLATFDATVEENVVTLSLAGTESAELPAKAVWDCQITNAGRVTTLAAGSVTMTAEVTR